MVAAPINQESEKEMGKKSENVLNKLSDQLRAADPMIDEKVIYWNAMHDKFNTTGLSLMQLNETPDGKIKADDICRKVGAAMVAKFGKE